MQIKSTEFNGMKLRGQENAAFQHAKHLDKKSGKVASGTPNITESSTPASLRKLSESTLQIYTPKLVQQNADLANQRVRGTLADSESLNDVSGVPNGGETSVVIGNGAKVSITSQVDVDNGNDTLIIGNGAKVNMDVKIGTDNSNDFMFIGNGAKVDIRARIGTDNGNDTIIVGNGAKLTVDVAIGESRGNGTLILEEGAELSIKGKLSSDIDSGVTYTNGKVSIELKDEDNKSFHLDFQLNDKQEFGALVFNLQDKFGKGKFSLDEIKSSITEFKDLQNKKFKAFAEDQLVKRDNGSKGLAVNKGMIKLEMLSNLVQSMTKPNVAMDQKAEDQKVESTKGNKRTIIDVLSKHLDKSIHDLDHHEKYKNITKGNAYGRFKLDLTA